MVEGIIFDVDGTILDSMNVWENAGKLYLKDWGIEAEKNLGNILFSMSMTEGAKYLKNRYSLNFTINEIIDGINNTVFKAYNNDVLPKEGIIPFLEYMRSNSVPMTVATTSDRIVIEAAFKRLGIDKYFIEIFTASEVGKGKDEPDIFIAARERMASGINNTWVVEDALYSIKTAKKAGFKTLGIYDDSSRENQKEIEKETDLYIKSWVEYEKVIEKMFY